MEKHRAAISGEPEQFHPEQPLGQTLDYEMNSLDLPQLFLQSLQKNAQSGASGPTTQEFFTMDHHHAPVADFLQFQSPEASYLLKETRLSDLPRDSLKLEDTTINHNNGDLNSCYLNLSAIEKHTETSAKKLPLEIHTAQAMEFSDPVSKQ